ncbi:hypothetical protein ACOME3_010706 [Neoechinorhynchus agilis]
MIGAIGLIGLTLIVSLIVTLAVTLKESPEVTTLQPETQTRGQFMKESAIFEMSREAKVFGGSKISLARKRDINQIFQTAMNGRIEEMALSILPIYKPHAIQVESVKVLST